MHALDSFQLIKIEQVNKFNYEIICQLLQVTIGCSKSYKLDGQCNDSFEGKSIATLLVKALDARSKQLHDHKALFAVRDSPLLVYFGNASYHTKQVRVPLSSNVHANDGDRERSPQCQFLIVL